MENLFAEKYLVTKSKVEIKDKEGTFPTQVVLAYTGRTIKVPATFISLLSPLRPSSTWYQGTEPDHGKDGPRIHGSPSQKQEGFLAAWIICHLGCSLLSPSKLLLRCVLFHQESQLPLCHYPYLQSLSHHIPLSSHLLGSCSCQHPIYTSSLKCNPSLPAFITAYHSTRLNWNPSYVLCKYLVNNLSQCFLPSSGNKMKAP